jgi:uncharacterized protein (TIGR00661 family)
MKIGLACNGEGFGHVSRAVAFYEALKDRYEIVIFAPHTVHEFLSRKAPGARVHEVPHMHLAKIADRIDYFRTFRENLPTFLTLRTKIVRMSHLLRREGIQALVNDYEPFTAIAAKRIGTPVLQFNHPGIVVISPSMALDALAIKIGARFMMPAFDKRMFVSFYNGDVGPMIRRELAEAPLSSGDYYVVSLKESYRRPVLKRLKQLGISNYRLFPNPDDDYVSAVAGCRAIITSAGHQTLSEAMYMKKPVFALPQRGQYEQRLNAQMLVAAGWGSFGSIRNLKRTLPRFIRDLDAGVFPRRPNPLIRFNFNNDSARIIRKIVHFIETYRDPKLAPILNVLFPEDEAEEDINNLWGLLPRKTQEMEDQRELNLRQQIIGEHWRQIR